MSYVDLNNSLFAKVESSHFINNIIIRLKERNLYVSNLNGSSRSFLIKKMFETEKIILNLYPDSHSVKEALSELSILGFGNYIAAISELTIENFQEKMTDILKSDKLILVSTFDILDLRLPDKENYNKNRRIISVGSTSYEEMIKVLSEFNYDKNKFVQTQGEYSARGAIIDFWSYDEKNPCRLEFDGDFLESIRYFDPESQRSAMIIDSASLSLQINNAHVNNSNNIFDYLNNPLTIISQSDFLKFLHSHKGLIIPQDSLGEATSFCNGSKKIDIKCELSLKSRWIIETDFEEQNRINLHLRESPSINSNVKILISVLLEFISNDYLVFIASENDIQSKRLKYLIEESKDLFSCDKNFNKISFVSLPIRAGFELKDDKILILSDYQIFNKPYRTKPALKFKNKKSVLNDFSTIKKGDFVVHENYGIGKYAGLESIRVGEIDQECIKIIYAEGDAVYTNINYLSLIKKYSSQDNFEPRLSRLGGVEWENSKKRVKKKIQEAARELIQIYAKRKSSKGFAFSSDSIWQKELEASFMYEDTPDQARAAEEVKRDMENESPMDRLICGDVGFGKTEVAIRAAFKAIQDGVQVAVLAPTTILCEQHYNTFNDRLSNFPIKIASISRFQNKIKQKEIIDSIKNGELDIIIGTHRLLSTDVEFKNLGLLIIDEEHRFGVLAKERLKSTKHNVDVLTLTATPIPRTLNLSLLGARDMSIIASPPPNRQPIYTRIESFDINKIREWIYNEINRGGQVYFIHDRVQSIHKIGEYLSKYMPEIKFGIAHGQMKPAELEKQIHDFLNKKTHVLLSTKIIESGIDIPNVNTIIINRADRFGLAELHQLRGRVGRSARQAYAYLLTPALNFIPTRAIRRLNAIEEYSELGAGFNLSMRDLEIRGAGNLLGKDQSGFFEEVGFDMYIKLLDEAVEELKRDEFKESFQFLPKVKPKTEPKIDLYFEVGIPGTYMSDQADRLSFYTSLFSINSTDELIEIKDEMIDRFGKPPVSVDRLFLTAKLKYYASYALFERILAQKDKVAFILPKGSNEEYYDNYFRELMKFVVEHYYQSIKFHQKGDLLKFEMINNFKSPEEALIFIAKFCKDISKLFSKNESIQKAV